MEEIDLKELLDFFISKIALFVIIVVGVCLVGSIYGLFIQKPMYNSYTTVILGSTETTVTQTDININKSLVNTYAEIVKSRRVLDQVIKELSLDDSYESLSGSISVSAVSNTEIIKISVNNLDPIEAKNVANVTAKFFAKEVEVLYNMDNVNILDEATTNEKPYNINVPKQIVIYFLVGVVLAVAILFVIYYFDRTVKSVEQVEQKIKLPILGSVQDISKGGR